MKVEFTIERDIPKDDYALMVKYLKANGLKDTFTDFCQRYCESCLGVGINNSWLPKARRYFKTGRTNFEKLKDMVDAKEAARPSIRHGRQK